MSSLLFKIIAVKYGFWIIVACRRSKHIFKGGWGCLLKASKVYEHLSYNNTSNLPTAKGIGFLLKWLVHSLLYNPRNMHSQCPVAYSEEEQIKVRTKSFTAPMKYPSTHVFIMSSNWQHKCVTNLTF